jgi:hypothetical protein
VAFRTVAAAVQDYLEVQIRAALPSVATSVCYPAGGLMAEQVWVSGEFDADVSRAVSGFRQRDEQGSVEVRVSVVQSTAEGTEPRDRALALAGTIEDIVKADPTLGGLATVAQVEHVKGQEAIPEETERQYAITLTISYLATVSST